MANVSERKGRSQDERPLIGVREPDPPREAVNNELPEELPLELEELVVVLESVGVCHGGVLRRIVAPGQPQSGCELLLLYSSGEE